VNEECVEQTNGTQTRKKIMAQCSVVNEFTWAEQNGFYLSNKAYPVCLN